MPCSTTRSLLPWLLLLLVTISRLGWVRGHGESPWNNDTEAQMDSLSARCVTNERVSWDPPFETGQQTLGSFLIKTQNNTDTDDYSFVGTLYNNCSVGSCYDDILEAMEQVKKYRYWKRNAIDLNYVYRFIDDENGTYREYLNKGRTQLGRFLLLKQKKQSDFTFLPLRLSHFQKIKDFLPPEQLYDYKNTYLDMPIMISPSCIVPGSGNYDILRETMNYHTLYLTMWFQFYLADQDLDGYDEDNAQDTSCTFFEEDEKRRPGVPFRVGRCCQQVERSLFQEEEESRTSGLDQLPWSIHCHAVRGSVGAIRTWTLVLMAILLLFLPMLIITFPSRPEPYKVLRDTTKRGHSLYHMAEDRHICLDGVNSTGLKVEIPPEEVEGEAEDEHCELHHTESDLKNDIEDNNTEDQKEADLDDDGLLPAVVTEGKDFRNELPDRLYLDSDPEFHLNIHIVFSYLLFLNIDSHILMVFRRLVVVFCGWVIIGLMTFMYSTYYPILLDEPLLNLQVDVFGHYLLHRLSSTETQSVTYRYQILILPAICTVITVFLLSPILLKNQPIAETLHCDGDLRFFGDPFPETIVEMKLLRRTPKPSRPSTYEDLVFRNLTARLANLAKVKFWKLLWERWILRGLNVKGHNKVQGQMGQGQDRHITALDIALTVFWLPVVGFLLVLHVLPFFSVWANYMHLKFKEAFSCSGESKGVCKRFLAVASFFLLILGIIVFYHMMWDLLVILGQLFVFVCIDILRNATSTLSKLILVLSLFIYVRNAFSDFEDGYRGIKDLIFDLCIEIAEAHEDELTTVVVKQKPYEPLYVKTQDGESSIPRRIFYEVCHAYRPYFKEITATFTRLFITFAIITILFFLISEFNIFDEFSEMGEPMLTVATVMLPSLLGVSKSSSHQGLSEQRLQIHIKTWLGKITKIHRCTVNLDKPTKRVVSTC